MLLLFLPQQQQLLLLPLLLCGLLGCMGEHCQLLRQQRQQQHLDCFNR